MSGAGSNFQSPVWSTTPNGVRSTTALGSGIEWVSVTSSSSNGPTANLPDIGTSTIGTSSSRPASASFKRSRAAVKGVA